MTIRLTSSDNEEMVVMVDKIVRFKSDYINGESGTWIYLISGEKIFVKESTETIEARINTTNK